MQIVKFVKISHVKLWHFQCFCFVICTLSIQFYALIATADLQKSDFHGSIADPDMESIAGSINSKRAHMCAHKYNCIHIIIIT